MSIFKIISELKAAALKHPANVAMGGGNADTLASGRGLPHPATPATATRASYGAGYEAGFAAGQLRIQTVCASEHFAGREAAAAKLLGNLKLSAAEIVGMLAEMPDNSGAEALALMRGQVPALGGGGSDDAGTGFSGRSAWSKAIAAISPSAR